MAWRLVSGEHDFNKRDKRHGAADQEWVPGVAAWHHLGRHPAGQVVRVPQHNDTAEKDQENPHDEHPAEELGHRSGLQATSASHTSGDHRRRAAPGRALGSGDLGQVREPLIERHWSVPHFASGVAFGWQGPGERE